jgi:lipopolysaccharide/colanic/teichoic acid biosynthesis glycosyltransferase
VNRTLDLFLALGGLILLVPLMTLIALLVLCTGSPVIFRQERIGWRSQRFIMFKFQTMTDRRNEQGELCPDDERLTRIGRFLRVTSLDELPELWNVVRGEMSLVGPRPLLPEYLPHYTLEQARRHDVRPGITGWAQVNGRNTLEWNERFALDVWYVDHRSWLLDIKILWMTLVQVLRRTGVSPSGRETMAKFTGTATEV